MSCGITLNDWEVTQSEGGRCDNCQQLYDEGSFCPVCNKVMLAYCIDHSPSQDFRRFVSAQVASPASVEQGIHGKAWWHCYILVCARSCVGSLLILMQIVRSWLLKRQIARVQTKCQLICNADHFAAHARSGVAAHGQKHGGLRQLQLLGARRLRPGGDGGVGGRGRNTLSLPPLSAPGGGPPQAAGAAAGRSTASSGATAPAALGLQPLLC